MAGVEKKVSCLITSKYNIRVFKKTIKSFFSISALKQRIRVRFCKNSLCIHSSAAGVDHNGKYLILYRDFFKEMTQKDITLELELDLKMLSQNVVNTKDQAELCIQMEKKSEEVGILKLLLSREGLYDKVVNLKANIVSPIELPEFEFTSDSILIESPTKNFDKFLSVFAGDSEATLRMTQSMLEFHPRSVEAGKSQGLVYAVNADTFSKYTFPVPGIPGNVEAMLPLEITSLVVEIAKERSLPIRIILESVNEETGNVFFLCEPATKEFRCVGTALSIKMKAETGVNSYSLSRVSIRERRSNVSELADTKEEQKVTIEHSVSLSQSKAPYVTVTENDIKASQESYFGGGINDDYI